MLAEAREQFKNGTPLFGKEGAFHRVLEDFLNAAMEGEMESHLQETKPVTKNRRNGKIVKTLQMPYSQSSIVRLWLDVCDQAALGERIGGSICFANLGGYLATGEDVIGGVAWLHVRGAGKEMQCSSGRLCVNNPMIGQYQSAEAQARAGESYGGFTEES